MVVLIISYDSWKCCYVCVSVVLSTVGIGVCVCVCVCVCACVCNTSAQDCSMQGQFVLLFSKQTDIAEYWLDISFLCLQYRIATQVDGNYGWPPYYT